MGVPRWCSCKESACQAGIARGSGLIPGLGRSPGVGNDNSPKYSCQKNFMDRGVWQATVHGVAKSPRELSATATTIFATGCL